MLMTAVTSTSLNTETTSIRSATSGNTESTGMSFVDSLVENTPHAEARPLDVGVDAKLISAVESDGNNPGKAAFAKISAADPEVRSAIGVAEKLQNGAGNAKSLGSPGVAKGADLAANKTNLRGTGAAFQCDGKPSDTDAASQSTIADDEHTQFTPETERNPGQSFVHDATDTTQYPDLQIANPVVAAGTDRNMKQVMTDKNEILVSGEKTNENSAATVAKDHDASVKTGKSVKAEVKQDKKDKPGVVVSALGVNAQATALVQVFVNPVGAQQSAAGDAGADPLASTSAINSGRSTGTVMAANSRNNKAAANALRPDDNSAKSTDSSSTGNPLSQKAEIDATKSELGGAANPDSEKAKSQSTAPSTADTGQLRAVSVASAPTPGVVSGNGLTPNTGAGLHMTDAISHAAATAQTGPNFIDTSSTDAAHKTLTATPTSLEVGVANGTHGWLKIRAEMADGGAVNTSLSTSSTAGQEMLHRELPSLAAYLKSEHVAVNAVVVQPVTATGSDPRGSFAGASGSEQGQAQQSGSQGREERQSPASPAPAHAGPSALHSSSGAMGEGEILSSLSYVQGGGWLSVRA